MFAHVTLRTADLAHTARLLTAPLAALGVHPAGQCDVGWDDFRYAEGPPTRHVHVGLVAPDRQTVNAFWAAGVGAGLESDGAPGPRTRYGPDYHGGFLLDPEGNSVEACTHERSAPPGLVDHVWLRVRDLAASRAFYASISEWTGFVLAVDEPALARFRGTSASLTVVAGAPVSEHAHLAFPARDGAAVDAFAAAAPARRGAFALDPDGHTVEMVPRPR